MNCPRCDKPIDEHQVSVETNVCVAVIVMEWRQLEEGGPLVHPNTNLIYGYDKKDDLAKYVPPYSTSIYAAWKIVEKMRERHILLPIWELSVLGDFPLRICRAALKEVSNEL